MKPRWGQDGEKIRKKYQCNIKVDGPNSRPPILIQKVANMAPTWLPKWSQDGQKIDPKINHFFDASWDRSFFGFCWILGAKMEASWYQNRFKNRCKLGKAIFQKSCSHCSGGSIFKVGGVQLGLKNRSKMDKKTKPKMECLLASILERFCLIWGAKLAPRWA